MLEDGAAERARIRPILAKSAPDIIVAMTSTIAEARAHRARFQTGVILLDNHLPDGSGANFSMGIRGKTEFSMISVVIVSDWHTQFIEGKED